MINVTADEFTRVQQDPIVIIARAHAARCGLDTSSLTVSRAASVAVPTPRASAPAKPKP